MDSRSPIADLTYRDYDGPISPPSARWKTIARAGIMAAFKKKAYWIFTILAGWYYLAMIAILYFIDLSAQAVGAGPGENPMDEFLARIAWGDQFLHGFSFGNLLWLGLALLLGAGAIANDNRTNALLVYLSRPCTKGDYLLGKWVGIFVPLLIAMSIPTMFFYIYGLMNYREWGFVSENPWLLLQLVVFLPLAAAFHTSLVLGVSSLFAQGRLAGATYAGLFFITNFFTQLMTVLYPLMAAIGDGVRHERAGLVEKLWYFSIDGLLIGLLKVCLDTDGSPYFGIPSEIPSVPQPPGWMIAIGILGLSAIALTIAWRRVRAVEVVK